jgi:prevent-host-death family protein
MKTMGAGAFKTHCLAILDEVHENGEEIVITKRGKPVAKVVPVEERKPESIFGFLRGRAKIVGNLVEPVVSPEDWAEADREWDELNK